jgi:hypothetical protein
MSVPKPRGEHHIIDLIEDLRRHLEAPEILEAGGVVEASIPTFSLLVSAQQITCETVPKLLQRLQKAGTEEGCERRAQEAMWLARAVSCTS